MMQSAQHGSARAAANLQASRAARRLRDRFIPDATLNGSYTHILDSQQQLPFVDRAIVNSIPPKRLRRFVESICSAGQTQRRSGARRRGRVGRQPPGRPVSVIAEVARIMWCCADCRTSWRSPTATPTTNEFVQADRARLDAGRGNQLDTAAPKRSGRRRWRPYPPWSCHRNHDLPFERTDGPSARRSEPPPCAAADPELPPSTPSQPSNCCGGSHIRAAERRLAGATAASACWAICFPR